MLTAARNLIVLVLLLASAWTIVGSISLALVGFLPWPHAIGYLAAGVALCWITVLAVERAEPDEPDDPTYDQDWS